MQTTATLFRIEAFGGASIVREFAERSLPALKPRLEQAKHLNEETSTALEMP